MNFNDFRDCDISLNLNGLTVNISKEARKRFRRFVRILIVTLGVVSALMGAAILIYSLITCKALLAVVVCAAISFYTYMVTRRKVK